MTIAMGLTACVSSTAPNSNTVLLDTHQNSNSAVTVTNSAEIIQTPILPNEKAVSFLTQEAAVKLLATEDSYIKALSPFDWQSKFKSDHKLSPEELADFYSKAVVEWDDESKRKVNIAVELLNSRIANLHLNAPDTYNFILTNGLVESGSAYTREDYIVLPTNYLDEKSTQESINSLVAHEFFHVYSRFNKEDRDKLYATLNFKELPPVELPVALKDLLITNPDAPDLSFGIDLEYEGEKHTFLPLMFAIMPYDIESDLSFFTYLIDALVAVDNVDGVMKPTMINGKPIVVFREDVNYNAIVQPNSEYLNHPEEVSAENFAMWVMQDEVTYKQPVLRLIEAMKMIH